MYALVESSELIGRGDFEFYRHLSDGRVVLPLNVLKMLPGVTSTMATAEQVNEIAMTPVEIEINQVEQNEEEAES